MTGGVGPGGADGRSRAGQGSECLFGSCVVLLSQHCCGGVLAELLGLGLWIARLAPLLLRLVTAAAGAALHLDAAGLEGPLERPGSTTGVPPSVLQALSQLCKCAHSVPSSGSIDEQQQSSIFWLYNLPIELRNMPLSDDGGVQRDVFGRVSVFV